MNMLILKKLMNQKLTKMNDIEPADWEDINIEPEEGPE